MPRKLRSWFRRRKLDAEMSDEMRLHLEQRTHENMAAGMSREDAHYAALRKFGGLEQVKELCREQRAGAMVDRLGRELRQAIRAMRRAPGFAVAVFFTLVICLGPNAAILSTLYSLVLKPLPFTDSDRLVGIKVSTERSKIAVTPGLPLYFDYLERADRFEGFALFQMTNTTIGEESVPMRASGYSVTAGFFELFGVRPVKGRFFLPEEERAGSDRVLVLSHAFWKSRYSADPNVVGTQVRMGGEQFTIVGVAPRALESLFMRTDFFKPAGTTDAEKDPQQRYSARTTLWAKLKPGVTPEAGRAQLEVLERRFRDEVANPGLREEIDRNGVRVDVGPLRTSGAGELRRPLWLLQACAAFVLLIGCVNVVNLLLARSNAKRPELAIRYALGASRGTLFRQMIAETLVLVAPAVAVGVALAWGALQAINRYLPFVSRTAPPAELNWVTIVAVAVIALGVAVLLAAVPFALMWRTGLRVGQARAASAGRSVRLLSSTLVVAQVAVALVLLVGAGLLLRSFAKVMAVEPGFDATQVVQGRVALPRAYEPPEANAAVRQRILAAMQEIPGVERVASVAYFGVGPASSFRTVTFSIRRSPNQPGASLPTAYIDAVSPGLFATLGVPLIEGREFAETETGGGPMVIIDQTLAERFFPGRTAIGEELALGAGPFPNDFAWPRIIGVVARANRAGLEERDGLPFLYFPLGRQPSPGFNLLVRTSRPTADLVAAMRQKLREIDPTLPLYNTGTLRTTLDEMLTHRRAVMLLLAAFSIVALLLAAVGLYGVLAYDVTQRTKEIGIRGAVGASRIQIVRLILGQGMWKTAVGLVVGLIGAVFVTRAMRTMLFDVTAADPVTFVVLPLALLAVALLACWLPARRAAKVDPVIALRAE